MKIYGSVDELMRDIESLHWDGAVFIRPSEWTVQPASAEILHLEGDDELEDIADQETHLPRIAYDLGMRQLLDVQTLQQVVAFEKKRNAAATTDDIIRALNHYLATDDFLDPKP